MGDCGRAKEEPCPVIAWPRTAISPKVGRTKSDAWKCQHESAVMKVNVEVTCTPEEARAFFGLPDLKPMQERVMGEIEERLRSSLNAMNPEAIFKTWLPASMQGVEQMQQLQQTFWSQLANIAQGKKE